MDTTPLREAYEALLQASITVLGPDDTSPVPPPGEWDATQILAHIASVDAGVLATVYTVASDSPGGGTGLVSSGPSTVIDASSSAS